MANNRHFWLAIALFSAGLGSECWQADQPPARADDAPSKEALVEKSLAEPLQPGFWYKMEFEEGRQITKARIVIIDSPGITEREVIKKAIEINDAEVLKLLQFAVPRSQIAVPRKDGALAGVLPRMRIELVTNKGSFNIQVFDGSFALSDDPLPYDSHRQFSSASLAYVLDAVLRKHGGDGLSDRSLALLSGELSIQSDIKHIKQLLGQSGRLNEDKK